MATINCYKVHYFFSAAGKKASPVYVDYVGAAANDYDTIATVLKNDGQGRGSGKLEIESVQTVGIPAMFT
jgi:hypothetical protein